MQGFLFNPAYVGRNLIRLKTFQEATKGNSRTVYDIEEELQDVMPVSDATRDNVIGRMNFIMDEARTKLTDTAVKHWIMTGPDLKPIPQPWEGLESVSPVDISVDEKLTEENGESSRTGTGTMWLDIVTDERNVTMKQKKKPAEAMGLEYVGARQIVDAIGKGEGEYAALGGAYVRFVPKELTYPQKLELDKLTDSWDAFLAVYNSLTLKYKGLLQQDDAVKIPGGPYITGRATTEDLIWNDFMDNKKVRNPTLDYVMRNVRMFGKYYDHTARKSVVFASSPAANDLAATVIRAVLRDAVTERYLDAIAGVVTSAPKRVTWLQQRESEDIEFQSIVPTFYADPDTGTFRVRMNVLDARFSMDAVRKSGICWSELRGAFDYTVRLRKYTVSRAVLKGVFGDSKIWIERGRAFLEETTGDGTNVELQNEDIPW